MKLYSCDHMQLQRSIGTTGTTAARPQSCSRGLALSSICNCKIMEDFLITLNNIYAPVTEFQNHRLHTHVLLALL